MALSRIRFCIAMMTALFLAELSGAQTTTPSCTLETALKAYLQARKPESMRIAAFDHKNNDWSGWTWDKATATLTSLEDPLFKLPAQNDPTLVVGRRGRAGIFVVNTNPFLYQAKRGAVTVEDSAAVEDLKKVLALMGGFVTSGVTSAASRVTLDDVVVSAQSVRPRTAWMLEQREVVSRGVARTIIEPSSQLTEIASAVNDLGDALERQLPPVKTATDEVVAAAKTLETASTKVASARDIVTLQLQLLENDPGSVDRAALESVSAETKPLIEGFDALRKEADEAEAVVVSCPDVIAALRQALLWKIDGVAVAQFESQEYRERWSKIIGTLLTARVTCTGSQAVGDDIQTIARVLDVHAPEAKPADQATRDLLLPLFRAADNFVTVVAKREGAIAGAAEALTKRNATVQQAIQLADFAKLRNESLVAGDDCSLRSGVMRIREIAYDQLKIGPTEVRTEEFAITVRPQFSAAVERQHDDAAGKFHLARTNFDVDFDTAVIWTKLYDRTFTAVKASATDTTFTIRETDRKTRAGQVALFVTGRPPAARGFGLQVGFGVDTSNPALYTGIAYRLGDYAKISVGETFQRVTKLRGGQFVGRSDLVTAEALSTRDGWTSRPYIALSLTLDDLPIFGGGAGE